MVRIRRFAAFVALVSSAAVAAAATPSCPRCPIYDIFGDFGSSMFQYGTGTGATFTSYSDAFATGCFGVDMRCFTNGDSSALPQVGKPNSGAVAFQTVVVPQATLFLHPGTVDNTVLQFTSPGGGDYGATGTFSRLDTTGNGNGVTISFYRNGVLLADSGFTLAPANGASQPSMAFNLGRFSLNAGDTLRFVIGNNGEYTYDSTGLSGSIAALPAPATWGLAIAGLGLSGCALRRRAGVDRRALPAMSRMTG